MSFTLQFLGGVSEVGRLGLLLESQGTRLLLDYGMAPHRPPKYPHPAPRVDAVLLSHAHLDHSGMVPWVMGEDSPPIFATRITASLSLLLCRDALKVARIEGFPEPYTIEDVERMGRSFRFIEYEEEFEVGRLTIRSFDAGHIPGSTMFEISSDGERLLFTGDLNLVDSKLVSSARSHPADILAMEATYAGREHPDRREVEKSFVDEVARVVRNGGRVVVPAFAVGRTQEVLMILAHRGFDVWLDGMGRTVVNLMLEEPRFLRDPKGLRRALDDTNVVRTPSDRRKAMEGDVIVTTNGMLEGGPVVTYVEEIRNDPSSAIFLTGFQVPGSVGRRVLDERLLEVRGIWEKLQCDVRRFDLSGHAAHSDLVRFTRETGAEDVVLFHSDNRLPLKEALAERRVHLPDTLDVLTLGAR